MIILRAIFYLDKSNKDLQYIVTFSYICYAIQGRTGVATYVTVSHSRGRSASTKFMFRLSWWDEYRLSLTVDVVNCALVVTWDLLHQ